ncbi:class I SAM-dependent methyltransferase [Pseudorhodoferax sp. Leaf267]|uniref:class I SAM-dependent methyltransferase n=1 Tax=Pseudorhodoferax sp. Leaf267 TaxID=1736316 RepID=UPI000701BF52|nr:class I SAM-dependent methyltransferase [Pseudorhodoferax sp. Leaf267]KQP12335.1 SAM-dependent methyltransferase [Pseudorhodoferax sp. Leaf267]
MLSPRSIDAVVTFRNSQGEIVRGVLTNYQRRSLVMEVYNPYSIVQVSEVLSELTVRSGERAVYRGKAVVVSLLNTGLMAVVSVTLTDEWDELSVMGHGPASYALQAQAFVEDWDARFNIGQDYQVAVSQMRTFLSDVSRWVDQADMAAALPKNAEGRLRDDVFFEIASPLIQRVRGCIDRLEDVARGVPEELQPGHRAFAQTAIHPLILRAPFVYRAFAKPLGYAGDYEMVNQMLGDPREGASTYFQIINAFFLEAAVARAHRNRIDILVDTLSALTDAPGHDGPVRVLNVGCGPAIEIQRLIASHPTPERFVFTLMDFSEETLAYTRSMIDQACARRGTQVQVELVHESVHNLLKRGSGARRLLDAQFDFVYCAGLFDYLSDKVCNRLLEYFVGRTRPGGGVLVTNVHGRNPDRHVMEHLLEWHLIYRDEAGMRAIAPLGASIQRLWTDATGVNVFMQLLTAPAGG